MANKISIISQSYTALINFVDDNFFGMINQALGAALRDVIKDYLIIIAQLESRKKLSSLTLQTMWYYLQPCYSDMNILKSIVDQIEKVSKLI